jgi:hypothetical protein
LVADNKLFYLADTKMDVNKVISSELKARCSELEIQSTLSRETSLAYMLGRDSLKESY